MIVVAGLILAFVLVLIFSNRATRHCRWREHRQSGCDTRTRWRCVSCGAEVVTADGRAPRQCHDPRRPKG
jgi:hypothetical protein